MIGVRVRAAWARALLAVIVLPIVAVGLLSACGGGEPHTFASIEYEPPRTPPPLRLTDQDGRPFDLADHEGRVVAVFFGYTHCPDVCPLTMGYLAGVYEALSPDQQADFQVVMVTTDPERDTPEALKAYLAQFDDSFIGLTGSRDQVVSAMVAWRIRAEVEGGATPAAGGTYTIGHTSPVVVIDRSGMTRLRMVTQMGNPDRLADIEALLREG